MTNEERKVIELALQFIESNADSDSERELVATIKEALAQPDQDEVDIRSRLYQRIHELETQLAQPDQEPVAWRYKPVRENNPRWEYTTKHPLDMGDGYLRPTLVEYCKCIEPLYAKEKPKLMLEKFREMKDLLDDPTPPQRTWVGLTDEEAQQVFKRHNCDISKDLAGILARAIEAQLKDKNHA